MSLSRKELLVELLSRFTEANGPDEMGEGSGYTGDRLLLMSRLWHSTPSFKELERCMKVMRVERPAEWWHIHERYLRCVRRQTMGCPECIKWTPENVRHRHYVNGKTRWVERAPIIEERWNPRVDMVALDRGLDYLSAEFRGEVFLPDEIYKLVAA